MGFWSKLFGKKADKKEITADETMENSANPPEETPEVSQEEKSE
jgi:hypothetical protein